MLSFMHMDGRHHAAIAVLDALAVAEHRNGAASVNSGVERNERRPTEEDDEKCECNRDPGADLVARVAGIRNDDIAGSRDDECIGAHAAVSALLAAGALSRATTSFADPI